MHFLLVNYIELSATRSIPKRSKFWGPKPKYPKRLKALPFDSWMIARIPPLSHQRAVTHTMHGVHLTLEGKCQWWSASSRIISSSHRRSSNSSMRRSRCLSRSPIRRKRVMHHSFRSVSCWFSCLSLAVNRSAWMPTSWVSGCLANCVWRSCRSNCEILVVCLNIVSLSSVWICQHRSLSFLRFSISVSSSPMMRMPSVRSSSIRWSKSCCCSSSSVFSWGFSVSGVSQHSHALIASSSSSIGPPCQSPGQGRRSWCRWRSSIHHLRSCSFLSVTRMSPGPWLLQQSLRS